MPKCPACGKTIPYFYKCDKCGDIRCSCTCTGTLRGLKGGASPNKTCYVCKKGKYQKV